MTTPPFRLDTGATWLNLLATRGSAFGKHPEERIPTPERLGEWLAAVELAPRGAAVSDASHSAAPSSAAATGSSTSAGRRGVLTDDDLALAIHLRETLRPLALAAATGDPAPPAAARELIAFLAAYDDPLVLDAGESGLNRPAPATATAALARIAREAATHLTGPERHTLKSCPESDCRGVFADPDDRRRWCPSPTCATRGRVRAHRARKAADQH